MYVIVETFTSLWLHSHSISNSLERFFLPNTILYSIHPPKSNTFKIHLQTHSPASFQHTSAKAYNMFGVEVMCSPGQRPLFSSPGQYLTLAFSLEATGAVGQVLRRTGVTLSSTCLRSGFCSISREGDTASSSKREWDVESGVSGSKVSLLIHPYLRH